MLRKYADKLVESLASNFLEKAALMIYRTLAKRISEKKKETFMEEQVR